MRHRYEVELAGRPLIIETGDLAQQAGGAVTLRYGDSMLLGTVTASTPRKGIDFFPLTVEFEERHYATGRIPGSFFRREGRPTTTAVLSARLTDRPLRPLFPSGYKDETQIVITILSVDMENPRTPWARSPPARRSRSPTCRSWARWRPSALGE